MKKSYVYKITCKITGEFYFGSSFYAKSDRYWGTGRKIKDRVALYGKENFVKEILGEFNDRVEAHKKENQYIDKFRHDDKCLNKQLDHKFGTYGEESRAKISVSTRGEKNPMFGKHFSKEHRAKLSAVHLGKHLSEETRAKLSASLKGLMSGEKNPMYGKHHTNEARAKMSAALSGENHPMYGKHFSEEYKAKISDALRGENHPMYGKHLSEETRAKISDALRGKHWRKNPVTGKREWYD